MYGLDRLREHAARVGGKAVFPAIQQLRNGVELRRIRVERPGQCRREAERLAGLGKRSLCAGVLRQRLGRCTLKAGVDVFRQRPLGEQFCAAAEYGNHGVIFRQHDHILPKRTVELIPAFLVAHPDLIAVAMCHFAVRRFDLLFVAASAQASLKMRLPSHTPRLR